MSQTVRLLETIRHGFRREEPLRKTFVGVLLQLTFLLSACVSTVQPPTPAPTTAATDLLVIVNGLILDGTGADPIPDGVLIIQGNRILAVGPATVIPIPAGALIIDAMKGAVLPGIINAHVHNSSDPATRRSFLLSGVTSTCDLATSLDSIPKFAKDDSSGPSARGFFAGPVIGPLGGYPNIPARRFGLVYPVQSPGEAREAVVDLVSRGADVIKIAFEPGFAGYTWPLLSLEEARAIVEEAHIRGKLVRAHITRSDMLDLALDSGVDVVEHIPVPLLSEAEWEIAVQDDDAFQFPAAYETQLMRMVDGHILMVPTLSVTPGVYDWYDVPRKYKPLTYKLFIEPVRRFHALGGIVALGNDYGNPGAEGGMPLGEMRLLTTAGLTPMEVIQAATKYAAIACGHGDELGTLEPGKLADVIVVDGNPLTDIIAMASVTVVISDGELVYTVK